jgi:hypothetical protein
MTAADRQRLYARARGRDMAEMACALKDTLQRTKANQKAFSDSYRGMPSGTRLRGGRSAMRYNGSTRPCVMSAQLASATAAADW